MARSIATIQQGIVSAMTAGHDDLSQSKVAEWRLLSYVVAAAIHAFEVVMDLFRSEVDRIAYVNMPGTVRWYVEMCKRFQYGNSHKLVFDPQTAAYSYEREEEQTRIVKVVAITIRDRKLFVKVAKLDAQGKIVPLASLERQSLFDYLTAISMAGTEIKLISTTADTIRYSMEVYYDPSVPYDTAEETVKTAIEQFKTALTFNAMFYTQRLVDAVMAVDGVVTVNPISFEQKTTANPVYVNVDVMSELDAGHFEYDEQSVLTLISI